MVCLDFLNNVFFLAHKIYSYVIHTKRLEVLQNCKTKQGQLWANTFVKNQKQKFGYSLLADPWEITDGEASLDHEDNNAESGNRKSFNHMQ